MREGKGEPGRGYTHTPTHTEECLCVTKKLSSRKALLESIPGEALSRSSAGGLGTADDQWQSPMLESQPEYVAPPATTFTNHPKI